VMVVPPASLSAAFYHKRRMDGRDGALGSAAIESERPCEVACVGWSRPGNHIRGADEQIEGERGVA